MPRPILSAVILSVIVSGLAPGRAAADGFTREYMVKAEFIVNLIRFTTWPESRRPFPDEPFRVGLCGSLPAARIVARALAAGRTVKGHGIRVTVGDIRDLLDSHLVFIAGAVTGEQKRIFPVLHDRSVLIVGEDDDLLAMGGMIDFAVVEHRLVLDVNRAAAEHADLALSARLLQVARTVITSYHPPIRTKP